MNSWTCQNHHIDVESRYDNPSDIQFMDNTLSNDYCWPVTATRQGFEHLTGERNRPEPNNGGINGFNTTNHRVSYATQNDIHQYPNHLFNSVRDNPFFVSDVWKDAGHSLFALEKGMTFNKDHDHPVPVTTPSNVTSPSLSTSYLPMAIFANSYESTGSSALNTQPFPNASSVPVPSLLSSGLPNLHVEHSLKSTANPSTNSASPAEPLSTLKTSRPSSLPTSRHLNPKSHPPASLESRFRQERLDYLGKNVDLDNTTNSALLSFARGLGYKQSLNNVQREEFSALRERQEREMIVKAIELGVHPDSAPHYRSIHSGGDRGKMLGKKYEELKAAAIEAGEEHLFLQAEKIKAASESSFHSFKVSHADDESTARAYMQKVKREARNGAFKMEASSDNASSFVNTLLTENCIRTKGMTHGLSFLNYMAAYIQSPHTLPSRITRSEAVNKREPVHHLRKHEDQLHSLDDCQYRDEKETYAKKLLKQLASNALQQDFKEWPVAKFDKIFKGWSFYCEESDMLSAEDFVNHMQAGLRRADENWLKVLIEQLEQGNVILQEKLGRSRKKQRM
ncbi:hypothetical protein BT69DRAFT_1397459 [Atractiella rhizophila]|nr:hypothetical protein BT69DRAFT_1397459 [Atractiella rhizophila]